MNCRTTADLTVYKTITMDPTAANLTVCKTSHKGNWPKVKDIWVCLGQISNLCNKDILLYAQMSLKARTSISDSRRCNISGIPRVVMLLHTFLHIPLGTLSFHFKVNRNKNLDKSMQAQIKMNPTNEKIHTPCFLTLYRD